MTVSPTSVIVSSIENFPHVHLHGIRIRGERRDNGHVAIGLDCPTTDGFDNGGNGWSNLLRHGLLTPRI